MIDLRLEIKDLFIPLLPGKLDVLLVSLLVLLILVLKALNSLTVLRQALCIVFAHSSHLLLEFIDFFLEISVLALKFLCLSCLNLLNSG